MVKEIPVNLLRATDVARAFSISEKSRKQVPDIPVETRGFPSPSLNGFGFVEDWK